MNKPEKKKPPTKAELQKIIRELRDDKRIKACRELKLKYKHVTYLEDLCHDLKERIDYLEKLSGEDHIPIRTSYPDKYDVDFQ